MRVLAKRYNLQVGTENDHRSDVPRRRAANVLSGCDESISPMVLKDVNWRAICSLRFDRDSAPDSGNLRNLVLSQQKFSVNNCERRSRTPLGDFATVKSVTNSAPREATYESN